MAEKNIVMQRKKADGSYDQYYPKTKVANVEGAAKQSDLETHLSNAMPHRFVDGAKTYQWGLTVKNGIVTMIYEEV